MRRGCEGVSTDDGRYGEVGEVKVRGTKRCGVLSEVHHGKRVRGMAGWYAQSAARQLQVSSYSSHASQAGRVDG